MSDASFDMQVPCLPNIRQYLRAYAQRWQLGVGVAAGHALVALQLVDAQIERGNEIGYFALPAITYEVLHYCRPSTRRRFALIRVDELGVGIRTSRLPLDIRLDQAAKDWFDVYLKQREVNEQIALARATTFLLFMEHGLLVHRSPSGVIGEFDLSAALVGMA